MHIPTRTFVTACALSAALLVAGCGGASDKHTTSGGSAGELFLQPVADQGPDPFTGSTATSTATPPPVTRTPQPAPTGTASAAEGLRSVSGGTPGLYGGTQSVGSCDVEKQIGFLTSDQSKARAFAEASGISQASIPGYLRGLTSVVLRADTRVTNHGFSNGRATAFQSVLQVGTAVLVDNRGVPRVRCACGNPLNAPGAFKGNPGTQGRPWSGYQPTKVIVVTPAPTVIVNITIINIVNNTWIERRIGDNGDRDVVVRPPDVLPTSPSPHDSSPSASPSKESPSPHGSPSDCLTPTETVTVAPGATESAPTATPPTETPRTGAPPAGTSTEQPSDCPTATATVTAPPTTSPQSGLTPSEESSAPETDSTTPDRSASEQPSSPTDSTSESSASSEGIGPDTVPDSPDVPDGGGLIPDESPGTSSIFDAPTDVFDS